MAYVLATILHKCYTYYYTFYFKTILGSRFFFFQDRYYFHVETVTQVKKLELEPLLSGGPWVTLENLCFISC